jgi:hypothetical protein
MPYIIREDRSKFIPAIENTVALIAEEKDSLLRAEYLGYFLDQFCRGFGASFISSSMFSPRLTFEQDMLERDKISKLSNNIFTTIEIIRLNRDILAQAGEMNYVMSAIIWGLLGDSLYTSAAKYGFRSYVKGILWQVYAQIENNNSRHNILLRGIVTDVIDEMYLRKTTPYEEQKIAENGDLWPLRDVNWVEHVPLDVRHESNEKIDQLYEE